MAFFKKLLIISCDNKQPADCGFWELIAVIPHPTIAGAEQPLFLSQTEDPATQWHYAAIDRTWFCPRCAADRRARELAARTAQEEQRALAADRLRGSGLIVPPGFQQAAQAPAPQAVPFQVPAPVNQIQAPLQVPAQSGNAPVMARPVLAPQPMPPVLAGNEQQPFSVPAQAPQGHGHAQPVPLDQMPVRFEPPPRG